MARLSLFIVVTKSEHNFLAVNNVEAARQLNNIVAYMKFGGESNTVDANNCHCACFGSFNHESVVANRNFHRRNGNVVDTCHIVAGEAAEIVDTVVLPGKI